MSAEITSLAVARAARDAPPTEGVEAARRYVALAEDAMALIGQIDNDAQQQAVYRIAEAWLALAEAELQKR